VTYLLHVGKLPVGTTEWTRYSRCLRFGPLLQAFRVNVVATATAAPRHRFIAKFCEADWTVTLDGFAFTIFRTGLSHLCRKERCRREEFFKLGGEEGPLILEVL